VERTEVRSETLPACGPNDPVNEVNGTSAPGVSRRRHPSVTLVGPDPGHRHEPGDLVPPDVVVGFRQKGAYKRAQPEESEEGSGPRPRSPSRRVPDRSRVVGVRVSGAYGRWRGRARGGSKRARDVAGRLCGHEERRGPTSGSRSLGGAPGSLVRSRIPAVSLEVTPGSSFADVRLSTHSDATPPRRRASSPPVRSHRPLSRSRRHVGRRGARRARSLRRCRFDGVARRRRILCARRRSRSLVWVVMALPPPTARPSRGTRRGGVNGWERHVCRVR